jgi:NodT family efflux transporter outer membrane factor (OMF) lipoprotein
MRSRHVIAGFCLLLAACAGPRVRAPREADVVVPMVWRGASVEILRDTLTDRDAELEIARRRAAAGYSTQLDLAQAQAAYDDTEQLIPATQLAIARQENGLSTLLGDTPQGVDRGGHIDALVAPEVPVSLPANLLRRRPDISAAEQRLVASDRALDAARAAFLPDITLAASGGFVGSTLVDASPVAVWNLGGSILAPLFDSGRLHAQRDAATARRDQAAFEYRKTALTAFREVEDALAAEQREAERERSLVAERDVVARALALATNRYRAGYSTYLEQLDAERSLLSIRLSLAQARADRLNAAVSLYQALGGGWVVNDTTQEDGNAERHGRNDMP